MKNKNEIKELRNTIGEISISKAIELLEEANGDIKVAEKLFLEKYANQTTVSIDSDRDILLKILDKKTDNRTKLFRIFQFIGIKNQINVEYNYWDWENHDNYDNETLFYLTFLWFEYCQNEQVAIMPTAAVKKIFEAYATDNEDTKSLNSNHFKLDENIENYLLNWVRKYLFV